MADWALTTVVGSEVAKDGTEQTKNDIIHGKHDCKEWGPFKVIPSDGYPLRTYLWEPLPPWHLHRVLPF